MNTRNLVIGILVFFALGIMAYVGFFSKITGGSIGIAECSDTDGGVDLYERGIVSGIENINGKPVAFGDKMDSCFTKNGKDWIKEYYCDYQGRAGSWVNWASKTEPCENGCLNGACI